MDKEPGKININLIWNKMIEGDQMALASLFNLYYSDLYFYGIKIFNLPGLVQDSIQDIFLRIWESRNNLGEVKNPKAYILASFRRKVFENKDKLAKEMPVGILSADESKNFIYDMSEFPEVEDLTEEVHKTLIDTVNALPERQRELIYLRFYMNMRYAQIAGIMVVNEQTVRNLMQRAMANLRKNGTLQEKNGLSKILFILFSKKN